MKKLTIAALLALAALAVPVSATTIQFTAASATTQRQVVLNDGTTPDPSGSLVKAGVFSNVNNFTYNPAASPLTNYNNMFAAGFSEFGLTQPGNGASEVANGNYTLAVNLGFSAEQVSGKIQDDSAVQSGVNASFFNGKQVYLVIFNNTTVAAASQMGVFTSISWVFPTNTAGTGGDVSTFATNTGTTVTAVNSAGQVNSSPNQLELASTTPEPTTLTTLIGAGGLLTLFRRRRSA